MSNLAIPKTIYSASKDCKCGAFALGLSSGQCVCAALAHIRREDKKYYRTIEMERNRLWHCYPKGESKTFKRMRSKLERYMIISLEGKAQSARGSV